MQTLTQDRFVSRRGESRLNNLTPQQVLSPDRKFKVRNVLGHHPTGDVIGGSNTLYQSLKNSMGPRHNRIVHITPYKRRMKNTDQFQMQQVSAKQNQQYNSDSQKTLVATTAISSQNKIGMSRSLLSSAKSRETTGVA